MAIIINTDTPQTLLDEIRKAIDSDQVITWQYDENNDFTHASDQYADLAWLRPRIYERELRFGIIGRKDHVLTDVEYGVYHGRFIEMLLMYFDKRFTAVTATATLEEPDHFK